MIKAGDEVICMTDKFDVGRKPGEFPARGDTAIVVTVTKPTPVVPVMLALEGFEGFYNAEFFHLMRTHRVVERKLKPLLEERAMRL